VRALRHRNTRPAARSHLLHPPSWTRPQTTPALTTRNRICASSQLRRLYARPSGPIVIVSTIKPTRRRLSCLCTHDHVGRAKVVQVQRSSAHRVAGCQTSAEADAEDCFRPPWRSGRHESGSACPQNNGAERSNCRPNCCYAHTRASHQSHATQSNASIVNTARQSARPKQLERTSAQSKCSSARRCCSPGRNRNISRKAIRHPRPLWRQRKHHHR
jgi:hypothetical protein